MRHKKQLLVYIDPQILSAFKDICENEEVSYSEVIEGLIVALMLRKIPVLNKTVRSLVSTIMNSREEINQSYGDDLGHVYNWEGKQYQGKIRQAIQTFYAKVNK